jgi:hypothetical protein
VHFEVEPLMRNHLRTVAVVLAVLVPVPSFAVPITFEAAGANAGAIQASVDAFRTALGTLNPNVAGSVGSGRREINWDGVPDALSAPNPLPPNFFNVNSPRGVVLSTPGTGFQVSSNLVSGVPIQFGNIDPLFPTIFEPFSQQRLFTALSSTITDVNFFIPGAATPALTNGFGAVFTDVDVPGSTTIEFFSPTGSLGLFVVPFAAGNETFSFLGVQFSEGAIVSRVRITSGNQVVGTGAQGDVVVMDDFIYGEPVEGAVPEPGALALIGFGAAALLRRRLRGL